MFILATTYILQIQSRIFKSLSSFAALVWSFTRFFQSCAQYEQTRNTVWKNEGGKRDEVKDIYLSDERRSYPLQRWHQAICCAAPHCREQNQRKTHQCGNVARSEQGRNERETKIVLTRRPGIANHQGPGWRTHCPQGVMEGLIESRWIKSGTCRKLDEPQRENPRRLLSLDILWRICI